MKLTRYSSNPILSPNSDNDWESLVTTNPAAWYDEKNEEVILLYRAAGKDREHKRHIGMAKSKDGYNFTRVSDVPVFSPSLDGIDAAGVEDPRLVKFGEYYYMTYAAIPFTFGQYWTPLESRLDLQKTFPEDFPEPFKSGHIVTCLAMTQDFKKWIRMGPMTQRDIVDHDVLIFPEKINDKYVIIHRPSKIFPELGITSPSIWISSTDDLLTLKDSKLLAKPEKDWEFYKIGGNAPPLKTPHGWLLLYHGVGADRMYRVGAMLLDLEDPSKVISRTSEAILEPEDDWEIKGHHNWGGVVFPCGNIIMNNKLLVYYGGADKYVGIAYCELDEIIDNLLSQKA